MMASRIPLFWILQVATLTDQRHISAIMAAVGGKEIKIQELNFFGNDLSQVNPFKYLTKKGYFQVAGKYLAGAVRNLNKLNLSTTNLSEGQV